MKASLCQAEIKGPNASQRDKGNGRILSSCEVFIEKPIQRITERERNMDCYDEVTAKTPMNKETFLFPFFSFSCLQFLANFALIFSQEVIRLNDTTLI